MATLRKDILMRLYNSFYRRRYRNLRKLYSSLVNELVVNFSDELLEFTVFTYALGKLLVKPRYSRPEYEEYWKEILEYLGELKDNKISLEKASKYLRELFLKMESEDPRYLFDMLTKAKIKTAATLYAKGVSLGTVAGLLKIPKEEILSYAGKTMMFDRVKEEIPVKKRLIVAEKLFGVEGK